MSRLDTPLDGTIGLPLSQTAHIEGRSVNAESSLPNSYTLPPRLRATAPLLISRHLPVSH